MKFELDDIEMINLEAWRKDHKCLIERISHSEKFIFVGNGIGTSVTVKCTRCKKKKGITNVDNW